MYALNILQFFLYIIPQQSWKTKIVMNGRLETNFMRQAEKFSHQLERNAFFSLEVEQGF